MSALQGAQIIMKALYEVTDSERKLCEEYIRKVRNCFDAKAYNQNIEGNLELGGGIVSLGASVTAVISKPLAKGASAAVNGGTRFFVSRYSAEETRIEGKTSEARAYLEQTQQQKQTTESTIQKVQDAYFETARTAGSNR